MNFGKKSVSDKRDKLNSSSAKVGKKAGVSALRVLLFGLLTVLAMVICLGLGAFKGLIDSAPDISDVNIMPMGYATFIYDSDGNEIQKLNSSDGNRISVSIKEIPESMQHAIVAIEDSRFYEHNGIDPRGIARAAVVAVKNRGKNMEGASTITQQLLKNNVFTNWTKEGPMERFRRKFQEQYLAVKLESELNAEGKNAKDVILENYLNTVNFGAGAYGIQTAAQTYFGKNSTDLTLSESAVLAAIPQNPSRYNPQRHPDYNKKRREKVLKDMRKQKFITEQEYNEAIADDVYARVIQTSDEKTSQPYTYFVDALVNQLKEDLMNQKGYSEVQAKNAIYSGGLKIYTTQDQKIQQVMDEEFQNPDNYPSGTRIGLDWALSVTHKDNPDKVENYSQEMLQKYFVDQGDEDFNLLFDTEDEARAAVDTYKAAILREGDTIVAERIAFTPEPQASMVVMDQYTGYVKGLVGGRGTKTASLTLNRATDTYRQPGSTFKILSTYGPALDTEAITLGDIVLDEPYQYVTGTPIRNADGQFHGNVSIRTAIQNSYNIVAVKTLTDITPQTGFDYLKKMGFDGLVDSTAVDIRQPLALGGISKGVTTLQLTSAYAAIANKGTYLEPALYTKVLDHDGNVLLDNTPVETHIFKDSTAYLLTSAMEDVVKYGTGTMAQLDNMSVAGKTGTTSSTKDLVFAGFTPYYTCSVWAGYDNNIPVPKSSQNFHKVLWKKVMSRIHEGLPNVGFEKPASVQEASIDPTTGLLAGPGCQTATEYYEINTVPKKRCYHVLPAPTKAPVPKDDDEKPDTEKPDGSAEQNPDKDNKDQNDNSGTDQGKDNQKPSDENSGEKPAAPSPPTDPENPPSGSDEGQPSQTPEDG